MSVFEQLVVLLIFGCSCIYRKQLLDGALVSVSTEVTWTAFTSPCSQRLPILDHHSLSNLFLLPGESFLQKCSHDPKGAAFDILVNVADANSQDIQLPVTG